ncbi:hypothetical protein [Streptomyces sp. NRRL F-5702]|uniref:hypothetical protein n=1 Tax=Streptomyces sp. NRRL F-5702 TaxID=1463870 RepID=UPI0004C8FCDD|nr:hypothetical protein [Streptomyces sp. NRRL F-5702]
MGRSSRSTGKGVWFAGAAVVVVLALTGYAMFSGDEDGGDAPGKAGSSSSASADPKPSESYAQPDDWTDPQRWAALPRGKRTDEHGSEVEFPHTTEGAVAALAAANTSVIEGTRSNVDEQLRLYYSYVAKEDQSEAAAERVELGSIDNGKAISREMGLKPGAEGGGDGRGEGLLLPSPLRCEVGRHRLEAVGFRLKAGAAGRPGPGRAEDGRPG